MQANTELSGAVGRLMAVTESYPELKPEFFASTAAFRNGGKTGELPPVLQRYDPAL